MAKINLLVEKATCSQCNKSVDYLKWANGYLKKCPWCKQEIMSAEINVKTRVIERNGRLLEVKK
jgi:phage FluMu protein Com